MPPTSSSFTDLDLLLSARPQIQRRGVRGLEVSHKCVNERSPVLYMVSHSSQVAHRSHFAIFPLEHAEECVVALRSCHAVTACSAVRDTYQEGTAGYLCFLLACSRTLARRRILISTILRLAYALTSSPGMTCIFEGLTPAFSNTLAPQLDGTHTSSISSIYSCERHRVCYSRVLASHLPSSRQGGCFKHGPADSIVKRRGIVPAQHTMQ